MIVNDNVKILFIPFRNSNSRIHPSILPFRYLRAIVEYILKTVCPIFDN